MQRCLTLQSCILPQQKLNGKSKLGSWIAQLVGYRLDTMEFMGSNTDKGDNFSMKIIN